MRLDAHVVEWLTENLRCAVDDRDIETTYSFPHQFNARRDLARQGIDHQPPENVLWHVEFYSNDGARVLEVPLARRVYASKRFYSSPSETGAVAYNATFLVEEAFRGKKLAKAVYASERDLYIRWGIREIQMRAQRDGPAVWIKKFGFQPQRPPFVAGLYREWAQRHAAPPDPPADAADYPAPFLSSLGGLMLYKVLT